MPQCLRYRPTRCPSLTCPARPAAAALAEHIAREHDGGTRGRDVVVRTGANSLTSSYVNLDREPLFYKTTRWHLVGLSGVYYDTQDELGGE
jgi:hypothetical protein